MKKDLWYAVWTLVGVTVGAGLIGMPYVLFKSGFFTGLIVIITVGLIMLLVNLYLSEILLRTNGVHQLSGLAEIYFGKYVKHFVFFFDAISIYGALVAYIIGAGETLYTIFNYGNAFYYSLAFIVFAGSIIFFNLNIFKNAEFFLNPLKLGILFLVCFFIFPYIHIYNLIGFNIKNILIPYGVVVFAFTGISVIPEMSYELKNKKNLKKAVVYAMLITVFVYIIFSFTVLGVAGNKISPIATVAIKNILGGVYGVMANLFTLLALSTAFVGLGFALKENFILDYKLNKKISWFFIVFIPLLIFLFNLGNFISFLEISGAIGVGMLLFFIIIMHSKAKKLGKRKPEFEIKENLILKLILVLLILIGIIYVIGGMV